MCYNSRTRARRSARRAATLVANCVLDVIFLIVTAVVAYHGITWRDEDGQTDFVRLLFGAIALLFFFRVLFVDVFKVWG